MFEQFKNIPIDPILGLMKAYQQDSNSHKIDLGVGVYKDHSGHTPIMQAVQKAQQIHIQQETTKTYVGMLGNVGYNHHVRELIFGAHSAVAEDRVRTLQTTAGTGALRVAADFIARAKPNSTIWLSDPYWANHPEIFAAAGLEVEFFNYYDFDRHCLNEVAFKQVLAQLTAQDILVLQGCCHNPCGMDLTPELWQVVADAAKEYQFTVLIDMAYQGLGVSLDQDAYGVRLLAEQLPELILCTSCSKNFGLYRERVGAMSIVAKTSQQADNAYRLMQKSARCIYSMPPNYGAELVNIILSSDELTQLWQEELTDVRNRINMVRSQLQQRLNTALPQQNFDFISQQFGMFSFLGFTPEQVARLKDEFSIYIVNSSRTNVSGLNDHNMNYFIESVKTVIG